MLPKQIERYLKLQKIQDLLQKVGLRDFLCLPVVAIDIMRITELITTIQSDGTCQITNWDGDEEEVHITKDVICKALRVLSSQIGAGFREKRPNLKVFFLTDVP